MSTHRDHSEYDLSGPPTQTFPLTDLSIRVPLADTSLVFPLLLGAYLLQVTGRSMTADCVVGDGFLHGGGSVHSECDAMKKMVELEIEEDVGDTCEEMLEMESSVGTPPSRFASLIA
ncbi:hypothetical protein TIFTF001_034429 [Ficus carica]|uniref:Uncharacterized protein n=1 Tax=Ficus carica TaxID=3494 RepID=A0AA88E2U2_FICCA|nr:hypothetical protein TIFTF001_034429 [Ficus carica]